MPMAPYKSSVRWEDKYTIVGFISSGTYGRVYKAVNKDGRPGVYAIKKFKPDKEGEQVQYTGISQSAIREISLCQELQHWNVSQHVETILQDRCIFLVFEYAEHDLLQLIQHHSARQPRRPLPASVVKSVMHQLVNGVCYLHDSWVMHRDLKPANILVTSAGQVRIGDLGLARIFQAPLQPLYTGDKVVVTIWYRAPELLLGTRHYTPAIDMWAVGCIFAELLALRPIFKGEEAKMDSKKQVPFQRNQMQKIVEILGPPVPERWPKLVHHPEFPQLQGLAAYIQSRAAAAAATAASTSSSSMHAGNKTPTQTAATSSSSSSSTNSSDPFSGLRNWYDTTTKANGYSEDTSAGHPGQQGFDLLCRLLEYDPEKRVTAKDALEHPYFFANGELPSRNCFDGVDEKYPQRKVSHDDNDPSLPGTKRAHVHLHPPVPPA